MAKLIKQKRRLWHVRDLALLWGVENEHTLHVTISRYVKKGLLYRVYRGLYSVVPLDGLEELELGVAVAHAYCYLSTETVLVQAGAIAQGIGTVTFAAAVSRRLLVNGNDYLYRQLADKYLYNNLGVEEKNGVMVATVERAVADMWYFNPKYHIDMRESVDMEQVKFIQRGVGYV